MRDGFLSRGTNAPFRRALAVPLALWLGASAVSAAAGDPLAGLKEGLPRSVAALIDRIVGCNHWLGEDAYDAERSRQISEAVAELRCSDLESDEATILRQLGSDARVTAALNKAKATVW